MREKGKRLKIKKIMALLLAIALTMTSADFTVLAAGADENPAAITAAAEEGEIQTPEDTYVEGEGASADTKSDTPAEVNAADEMRTAAVNWLSLQGMPQKTTYIIGQDMAMDYTGLGVCLGYMDGAEEYVYDGATVSERGTEIVYDESAIDWNNLHPGSYEIIIKSGDNASESFSVNFISADKLTIALGEPLFFTTDPSKEYTIMEFTPDKTGDYIFSLELSPDKTIPMMIAVDEQWNNMSIGSNTVENTCCLSLTLEAGKKYFLGVASEGGFSATATVDTIRSIQSAELMTPPERKRYMSCSRGSEPFIDFTGMEIRITFTDGTEERLLNGDILPDGRGSSYGYSFDWDDPGEHEISFQYDRNTAVSVPITIVTPQEFLKELESLEENKETAIQSNSDRLYRDFKFTPTNSGTYKFKMKTEEFTSDPWITIKSAESGNILMDRGGRAVSFELEAGKTYIVMVDARSESRAATVTVERVMGVTDIQILSPPSIENYLQGNWNGINYSGIKVKVTYEDGSSEEINSEEQLKDGGYLSITNDINIDVPGTYYIYMSWGEITDKVPVYVLTEEDYLKDLPHVPLDKSLDITLTGDTKQYVIEPEQSGDYIFTFNGQREDLNGLSNVSVFDLYGEWIPSVWEWAEDCVRVSLSLEGGKKYLVGIWGEEGVPLSMHVSKAKDVKSLEILTKPDKTKYVVLSPEDYGDVDFIGLTARVVYEDGEEEILSAYQTGEDGRRLQLDSSEVDLEKLGEYQAKVSFGGKSSSFTIQVITEEEYLKPYVRLNEGNGQSLELPEGVSKYVFTPLTSGEYVFCLSGFDGNSTAYIEVTNAAGNYVPQYNYSDAECYSTTAVLEAGKNYICCFTNTTAKEYMFSAVKAKDVESLEIVTKPVRTDYMVGEEEIHTKGLSVKAVYNDGSEELLLAGQPAADYRCLQIDMGDIDFSMPGEYQAGVSFGAIRTMFAVHVLSQEDYLKKLDSLQLGTERTLNLPAGGKDYVITPQASGTYMVSLAPFTEEFNVYNDFVIRDMSGNRLTHGLDNADDRYSTSVELQEGAHYIVRFTNETEADISFTSFKCKDVQSLEIVNNPYKTEYLQQDGEYWGNIQYEGLRIRIQYTDNSEETVGPYQATKEGRWLIYEDNIDFTEPGADYNVIVSLGGKSVDIPITVLSREEYINRLETISLSKTQVLDMKAGNNEYVINPSESGNYTFRILDAEYTDIYGNFDLTDLNGVSQISDYRWSNFYYFAEAKLQKGHQYICQFTNSEDCKIQIKAVKTKAVSKLEINNQPEKTNYLVSEYEFGSVDTKGMDIKITYEDGSSEIVQPYGYTADDRQLNVTYEQFDWREAGTYPITVSVDGKSISFDIHILPPKDYLELLERLEMEKTITLSAGNDYGQKEFKFTPSEDGNYIMCADLVNNTSGNISIGVLNQEGKRLSNQSGSTVNGQVRLAAELKANETYIYKLNYSGDISLKMIRGKEAGKIKLLSLPLETEFQVGGRTSDIPLGTGIVAEITYKDGSKEQLKLGQVSSEGIPLYIDSSQLNWSEPGIYTAKAVFAGISADFNINILSNEAYYAASESWDMADKSTVQEAGKKQKLSFTPASSGYYRLIVDTLGEVPAASIICDDTYNIMSYRIKQSNDFEIGRFKMEYIINLTAGKQYYLQIINNSVSAGIAYQLELEKMPEVESISVNTDQVNLVYIAGTSSQTFVAEKLDVEAIYADGTKEKLTNGMYELNLNYNANIPGVYPQTVKAFGKEANFELKVIRPQDYQSIQEIELNELKTLTQDTGGGKSYHLYKFIPSESRMYYVNMQSGSYTQLAVLTGSGNTVRQTNYSGSVGIDLIEGITYYIFANMSDRSASYEMKFMISNADLQVVNLRETEYTGEEFRPQVKVVLDGKILTAEDYTVSYGDNIDAGIGYALVKVKGQNALPAMKSYFRIYQKSLSGDDVSGISAQGYTGQEICPKPVVAVNGRVLKEGTDYTLRYLNNVEVGTAQVSVIGKNNYTGVVKKTFEIQAGGTIKYELNGGTNNKDNPDAYGDAGLTLKAPSKKGYTFVGWYTDSKLTKKITQIPGSPKKDYVLYAGWKKITLGKTSISSLTNSGTSALKVEYGTVKDAEGYEVNYAVNSVFTSGKTIESSKLSASITGLKAGTTYYVRVRAFKTDSTGEKVYGDYCAFEMYKTAPAAPQINTVTGGTNKITVSWDKVTGVSYYEVYMATSKTGTYSKIASVKSGTTSYAKSGLSTAKTYYFKVRAYTTLDGSKIYGSFGTIKYGTTATAAPAISSAAGGSGKATIKWGAVTGASGYAVYMAASANGTYSKLTTVSSSTLSYTKTGLSAAKTYYFKVRAYRKGEGVNVYSSYSAAKSAGTAPAVPQISALTGGTGKITLSWKDVSGESKYEVYRATSEKGTYSRIATLNANTTSYTNSGLSAAKTYYYKIRAYRTVNGANVYSSFGSVKYGTTAPSVPAITSAAGGTGKITVKWKAVTGASGYALYMATSASGTYSKVAALGSSTLSYTKTGLSAAKNYYFKVRAYRTSGGANVYSGYSSAVSGGTATATPQISAVTGGTGKVTLTWKDVSGESKYQVYRATSEKGTYSRIATLNANTKSYTNTGLSAAKTYYYKVRSYRVVNGANVYSSFGSVKYAATAPSVPSITSVAGGTGKITVKWKAVTGASGYALYMSTSASGTYSKVAALNSSTLSYTKTGLSAAKNYYFKIRAYRTAGGASVYSGYSSAVSGGTATSTPTISKAAAGKKKVTLTWKDVSGETKYQVYMSDSKNGTYSLAATLNANTKSYSKTGLTGGKTYYFKIRTYRTVNGKAVYSGFSAVKSAVPSK